ncbi:MAG: hypothetical protein ACRDSR_17535 [Pseudonocardiaceae bacterium]
MFQQARTDGDARPLEWWMTSHLALALAFNCFLPVLLPAYVLSVGGTAMDIALAMSMAGVFALIGPSIGGIAVRHRAHRLIQALGVLGMAAGLMALALSDGDSLSIVLAIAVMGIGAAAVAITAPTFILGTNLPADIQERQLTWLQLNLDLGKIVGGLLLGMMASARLPFAAQFRAGALAIGLLAVLVWMTSRRAAARIRPLQAGHRVADEPSRNVVPLKTLLLLSLFGVPVVVYLLGSMTMMETQISTMLMVSGLFGIGLYLLAGRWMVQSSPSMIWATGHALRGAGGTALGALGLARGMPQLVVLAAFLVLESLPAVVWIIQARASAQFVPGAAAARDRPARAISVDHRSALQVVSPTSSSRLAARERGAPKST